MNTGWIRGILAGFALVFLACGGEPSERVPPAAVRTELPEPAEVRQPNLLLITMDTTRADRLGCYGHPEARTPHLDRLARAGVLFRQAMTQVPLTLPAHASLFTELHPPSHGLRVNGRDALGDDLPLLAELLGSAGYRTGAFVASEVLDSRYGLARGFDRYDQIQGAVGDLREVSERRADLVADAALDWLSRADPPWMAWVHFFDPHEFYAPPAPFGEVGADAYDGEIAFMDRQIGRLLDQVDRSRTAVIAVGDHGEALGEHRERQHGLFVYETTLWIPLLMAGPWSVPSDRVLSPVVQLVDLMPTSLALAGLEPLPDLDGVDLGRIWRGEGWQPRPAYAETQYPLTSYRWAPLASLITERWKLVRAPRSELFDRRADPAESTNVIQQNPRVAGELDARLGALLEARPERKAEEVELDPEQRERLAALGYITEAMAPAAPEEELPDPKDRAEIYHRHQDADLYLTQHRYRDVLDLLEPLARGHPEELSLQASLGEAYLALKQFPQAEQALRACLKVKHRNPARWRQLGDALRGQGKAEPALEAYREALDREPDFGQVHSRIGLLLGERGEHQASREHFEAFVRSAPGLANARSNLGTALLALDRPAEAATRFQEALDRDPDYQPAHNMLWRALALSGRGPEALRALEAAVERFPEREDWARELERQRPRGR